MAMLLESGIPLFVVQLLTTVLYTERSFGYDITTEAILQIYGITPAILLIRVASGQSYEATTASRLNTNIQFASRNIHRRSEISNDAIHLDLDMTEETTKIEQPTADSGSVATVDTSYTMG
ncbi:hypothetical protein M422DRAFT_43104 [Sphaerobolus stellatus SS14]|nr:hypothetical protein M422DRAFT_43104 [Sphaerobolus stellatus SS14]